MAYICQGRPGRAGASSGASGSARGATGGPSSRGSSPSRPPPPSARAPALPKGRRPAATPLYHEVVREARVAVAPLACVLPKDAAGAAEEDTRHRPVADAAVKTLTDLLPGGLGRPHTCAATQGRGLEGAPPAATRVSPPGIGRGARGARGGPFGARPATPEATGPPRATRRPFRGPPRPLGPAPPSTPQGDFR